MSTKVNLNKKGLSNLKLAVSALSQFIINASDTFSFEEGIIADTQNGVVLQFKAGDWDGGEQILQITNLTPTTIFYGSTGNRLNKYTKEWSEVGLRGDAQALYPYFQRVINSLDGIGILVDRLQWDFGAAYFNNMTLVTPKKIKGGNFSLTLNNKNNLEEGY